MKKCKHLNCFKDIPDLIQYCPEHEISLAKIKSIDPINPSHYKSESGLESIDVIEAFKLGFNLGNAVKYILRSGKKDPTKTKEDLEKAIWYLNRQIKNPQS